MNVALLTGNFPPEAFGGTEMVVAGLSRALQDLGHRVVVICSSDEPHQGRDVVEESWEGLRVRRLFRLPEEHRATELDRPRLLALVRDLLTADGCQLVHAHHLAALGTGQLRQAREMGLGAVMSFHDLWTTCPRFFREPPDGIACPTGSGRDSCVDCVDHALHRGSDWVREALLRRDTSIANDVAAAHWLTAPSRTAAEQIRRHLPWDGDVKVIPHGLVHPVPADGRAVAPRSGEALRIGTFGNLVAAKGVEELLFAVVDLPVELHLSGRFLEAEFEARIRRLATEHGVKLFCHGPFDTRSPHPAGRLHLAVFPSRCQETYGLVVDEALAHGVPAVVSDNGALRERGEQGGVLVTSLSELAANVRSLVVDRERYHALRAAVPERLSTIGDAARHYHRLYQRAQEAR